MEQKKQTWDLTIICSGQKSSEDFAQPKTVRCSRCRTSERDLRSISIDSRSGNLQNLNFPTENFVKQGKLSKAANSIQQCLWTDSKRASHLSQCDQNIWVKSRPMLSLSGPKIAQCYFSTPICDFRCCTNVFWHKSIIMK